MELRFSESVPIQAQLADDVPQRTHLEVFAAPVRYWCDPTCGRIVPLAVRATAASGEFFAAQGAQLVSDLSVFHATTAVSIQKGVWRSSATRSSTGGSGQPRSS